MKEFQAKRETDEQDEKDHLSLDDPVADRVAHEMSRFTALRSQMDIVPVCFDGLHADAER